MATFRSEEEPGDLGKDVWKETDVKSIFQGGRRAHACKDASENDRFKEPECLHVVEGNWGVVRGSRISTSVTWEEFGFYGFFRYFGFGHSRERLEDSEQKCGIQFLFKKDFL